MKSDPRIGYWTSWSIAALGAAWLAAMVIDGDRILDVLGHAAFAVSLVAVLFVVSGTTVGLLFRRFVRVRDDLVSGRGVGARWSVGREDWQAFAGRAEEDIHTGHNGVLLTIVAADIVVCAGLAAFHPRNAVVIAWIGLAIAAVGGVGWLLGRRASASHLTYHDGEVIVGDRGMMVNGVLHVWGGFGSRLDGIELIEDERPGRLAVTYSFLTRAGRQYQTVYAPMAGEMLDITHVLRRPQRARASAGTRSQQPTPTARRS